MHYSWEIETMGTDLEEIFFARDILHVMNLHENVFSNLGDSRRHPGGGRDVLGIYFLRPFHMLGILYMKMYFQT
jgi:hypothetical protein